MNFELVDESNTGEAMHVLARAFHDDPVMNWCCNYPDELVPFFEITLPPFLPHGLAYMAPEREGIAVWLGPGQKLKWDVSLANVARVMRLGGLKGVYRMLRSGNVTEREHPKTPHYYLFAIGVTPGNQGKGLGSRLISRMLRTCDEEGVPAYLENSKEDNLPFYRGHGFEVLKEIRFASSAPPLWLMWREPVTRGK